MTTLFKYFAVGAALIFLLSISTPTRLWAAETPAWAGPMIGHTTATSTQVWMWSHSGKSFHLRFGQKQTPQGQWKKMRGKTEKGVARFLLEGLRPATAYQYQVVVDGKARAEWRGQWKTAPKVGEPSRFTVAVSSCMNVEDLPKQPAWRKVAAAQPDFQLLLGDNIYGDTNSYDRMWNLYLQQRRVHSFATLIRNVPTYAVWDDHDYGTNNSDKTNRGKEVSLEAFRRVWANPAYGAPDVPGVFYTFRWGDVEFFVLDARYYRSPNEAKDGEGKRMLGKEQFSWLTKALSDSKAPFRVLACGTTINSNERKDSWETFTTARKRLFNFIRERRINGVLYLSGDIHKSKILTHETGEDMGYPLVEIISSGIAVENGWTGCFVTLAFDTQRKDPTLTVRIHSPNPNRSRTKTIHASELEVAPPPTRGDAR